MYGAVRASSERIVGVLKRAIESLGDAVSLMFEPLLFALYLDCAVLLENFPGEPRQCKRGERGRRAQRRQ